MAVHPLGTKIYTMEDVQQHNRPDDMWIVINSKVYDVTQWSKVHPGGAKIISHYAGQDATDAWIAVHTNPKLASSYLPRYLIGYLNQCQTTTESVRDFRNLRDKLLKMGVYNTDPVFYFMYISHILVFECLSVLTLYYYGTGWLPWILACLFFTISQAQAGWLQHDFGHLGVFRSSRWNHIMHHLVAGLYKGASSHWWNFRHQQHHVKPNLIHKDPDIDVSHFVLLGKILPSEWGRRKLGYLPYHLQHHYFGFFVPSLLLPIYFHIEIIYFIFKRHDWLDILLIFSFGVRIFFIFHQFLGIWGTLKFYLFCRSLESHWFVWCTQMSHLPMPVERDLHSDWLTMQVSASCNVEPGWFTDWFSGRLNYQIEHHLFPTIPSHNYHVVKPYVMSLCHKHNLPYTCRPSLIDAWSAILRSLKESGEIYREALLYGN